MPNITINDETFDAEVGETVLAVARRNASHIGFVCDGRGLCQTCECHVNAGSENLSPLNEVEMNAMTESRRERGYRLACQTTMTGSGPVNVISYTEQVRRQAMMVFSPPQGTSAGENIGLLLNYMTRFALDYTSSLPYIAMKAVPQFASQPPNIPGSQQWINDSQRVIMRVIASGSQKAESESDDTTTKQ